MDRHIKIVTVGAWETQSDLVCAVRTGLFNHRLKMPSAVSVIAISLFALSICLTVVYNAFLEPFPAPFMMCCLCQGLIGLRQLGWSRNLLVQATKILLNET